MNQQIGVFEWPRIGRPGDSIEQKTQQGNWPAGGAGKATDHKLDNTVEVIDLVVVTQRFQVGEIIEQERPGKAGPIDGQTQAYEGIEGKTTN